MSAAMAAVSVRVLVVDDQPMVRDALRALLIPAEGATVVGVLDSADDLVGSVVRLRPDIILLDLEMPGRSALEAVQDLRYRGHPARAVILSAYMKDWQVRGALAYGALGYVHKDDGPQAIFDAIAEAMRGRRYLSPTVAAAHPGLA